MAEFTKTQRRAIRELIAKAHETETGFLLQGLERQFVRWRAKEISSQELLDLIHGFHNKEARQLWSIYQTLREPELVARAVALKLIPGSDLPEDVRAALLPLIDFFASNRE